MNKIEEYKNKLSSKENLLDLMYENNDEYLKKSSYIEKHSFYEGQKDGIDIDVCKYNMFIYGTCYEKIATKTPFKVFKQNGTKYELLIDSYQNNISYRGDTAINCTSVLTQIMKYENSGRISKKVINEGLKRSCMYNDLQENLEEHAKLCYSVGNYYPIPFLKDKDGRSTSLNRAKWHCSSIGYKVNFSDDMSVFLEDIKQYFETREKRGKVSNHISDFYNDWIKDSGEGFEGWKCFVNTYYFNSFVDKDYKPIRFWNIKQNIIDEAKNGDQQALISYINNYLEAVNTAITNRTEVVLEKVKKVSNNHVIGQLLP